AYVDVMQNTDLFPALNAQFRNGKEPAEFAVIDDHTFSFTFAEPKGQFLGRLASANVGAVLTACPKHYLSEFHIDYNKEVADLAKSEGFDDWAGLFAAKGG